jgi:hypothetical protein
MFNSIVMVKQVPDTANISGQVMKEDGTVNRAKLPAIFNHEDRVALELALQVKDKYGGKVSVITMGPPPDVCANVYINNLSDVVKVTQISCFPTFCRSSGNHVSDYQTRHSFIFAK